MTSSFCYFVFCSLHLFQLHSYTIHSHSYNFLTAFTNLPKTFIFHSILLHASSSFPFVSSLSLSVFHSSSAILQYTSLQHLLVNLSPTFVSSVLLKSYICPFHIFFIYLSVFHSTFHMCHNITLCHIPLLPDTPSTLIYWPWTFASVSASPYVTYNHHVLYRALITTATLV